MAYDHHEEYQKIVKERASPGYSRRPIDEVGMGGVIKRNGNAIRDQFLHETASGALTIAGSGFGKGILAVAALAIGGAALLMGGIASVGGIELSQQIAPDLFQNVGKVGLMDGLIGGAKMGLGFLTTPLGFGVMGATGIVSGVNSWKKNKNEVSEAMAVAEMRAAAKAAAIQPQQQPEQHVDMSHEPEQTTFRDKHPQKAPAESHVAQEMNRKQNGGHDFGIQGVV